MKRTSLEIMAEMLSLCKDPQGKTRVMYRTNLNWRMTIEYLSFLQSRGFLRVHHSPNKYEVTQRGSGFLEKWREIKEFLQHGH